MFMYLAFALALTGLASAQSISVTPHQQFSSSIGVLGCKIDNNYVAYWPSEPDCNDMCVKVTANGRSVTLLHIDQSGGAYDISYDAWNYLNVGQNATTKPTEGGGIPATWQSVPMSECADVLARGGGKLGLQAANSIDFYVSCPAGSWVAENSALWNIDNSACTLGYNEQCTLNLALSNQPSCPHELGLQTPLTGQPVYDIVYGTGAEVLETQ